MEKFILHTNKKQCPTLKTTMKIHFLKLNTKDTMRFMFGVKTNLVSLERPYGIHSGQSLMFALDLRWEVCNLGPTMEEKTIICTCNPSLCWS